MVCPELFCHAPRSHVTNGAEDLHPVEDVAAFLVVVCFVKPGDPAGKIHPDKALTTIERGPGGRTRPIISALG